LSEIQQKYVVIVTARHTHRRAWPIYILRHLWLTTPQPFYGPFSGTTRVSRCQKITSGLYGARGD